MRHADRVARYGLGVVARANGQWALVDITSYPPATISTYPDERSARFAMLKVVSDMRRDENLARRRKA